jgi:hypothetical protein
VTHGGQRTGQLLGRLGHPHQQRHRITTGGRIDQRLQRRGQLRVRLGQLLGSAAGCLHPAARAPRRSRVCCVRSCAEQPVGPALSTGRSIVHARRSRCAAQVPVRRVAAAVSPRRFRPAGRAQPARHADSTPHRPADAPGRRRARRAWPPLSRTHGVEPRHLSQAPPPARDVARRPWTAATSYGPCGGDRATDALAARGH